MSDDLNYIIKAKDIKPQITEIEKIKCLGYYIIYIEGKCEELKAIYKIDGEDCRYKYDQLYIYYDIYKRKIIFEDIFKENVMFERKGEDYYYYTTEKDEYEKGKVYF